MGESWEDAGAVIGIVGRKWVLRLLQTLDPGPRRHNELLRAVGIIQPRVMDDTLRRLESAGMVARTVEMGTPPRVSYELTSLARSLLPALDCLARWVADHRGELQSYPGWRNGGHAPAGTTRGRPV